MLPPLVLTLLVYGSIVRNYFHDDDFLNLYRIVNSPLLEYLLAPHAGHVLLTRNAIFAFDYQVFGMRPHLFFATVLLTHLINVGLLFHVIRGCTTSPRIACVWAALWGASAAHENVLSWYSVYGQVLVGTLLLAFLVELQRIIRRPQKTRSAGFWLLLFFASITSFGLGLAVAIGAPLLAFLILPPGRARRRVVLITSLIAAATPFVYAALHLLYTYLYGSRDTLGAAVGGLEAWRRIPGMVWQLLQFGTLHQVLSPARVTPNFPVWLTPTVLAVVAAMVLFALTTGASDRRRQILGFLALCLACYGLIAFGRAKLMRAATLEHAEQLRYQYVATLPLTLALSIATGHLARLRETPPAIKNAVVALYFALALVSHAWLAPRRPHQEGARNEVERTKEAIRRQVAAQPAGTTVVIANRYPPFAVNRRWIPPELFPGSAGLFTIFFPENVVDGRRVVFADPDPKVVAAHAHGRRTASLIIPATDVVGRPTPLAPKVPRPPAGSAGKR